MAAMASPYGPAPMMSREQSMEALAPPSRVRAMIARGGILPAGRERQGAMEIHELVIEMKLLERRMTLYEEKYGILSKDFYEALMSGKLERFDEFDETRADFSRWKGIYETWSRRKKVYDEQLTQREVAEALRFQPAYWGCLNLRTWC